MTSKSEMHHRRSIRLQGYDYSQPGAYFVTICVHKRRCLLGEISADGLMCSNEMGQIAQEIWNDLSKHYPYVVLDAFILMPNHMHGILFLLRADSNSVGAGFKPAPTLEMTSAPSDIANSSVMLVGVGLKPAPTENERMAGDRKIRHGLPEIVRAFKTFSSRQINAQCGMRGHSFWQRNYYEHVIRDDEELNRARQYIMDNPKKWTEDEENPVNMKTISENKSN